jgi:hypothetical protein
MNSPNRYIHIRQGATIAVFLHKVPADDGTIYTRSVEVIWRSLKQVLMRHKRRFGRRPFSRWYPGGGSAGATKTGGGYAVVFVQ